MLLLSILFGTAVRRLSRIRRRPWSMRCPSQEADLRRACQGRC
ncbi:hypothetical protein BC793_113143 [Actinoplanes xinjiangensis]|uniref:Uncharacterized protein n=1 Tax=Actinoplanes xinjiangensis TaxID=512350 RepID=A0A316FBY9_9ACTN|nr:hypothetical protein BC793_113143 [Actinoplanes xinjiangensis]